MNLLRNTYGNTTLMIDKTKNRLGKAAWHDFTASQEVIRLLPKLNKKHRKITIKMTYGVIILYHPHMSSVF